MDIKRKAKIVAAVLSSQYHNGKNKYNCTSPTNNAPKPKQAATSFRFFIILRSQNRGPTEIGKTRRNTRSNLRGITPKATKQHGYRSILKSCNTSHNFARHPSESIDHKYFTHNNPLSWYMGKTSHNRRTVRDPRSISVSKEIGSTMKAPLIIF